MKNIKNKIKTILSIIGFSLLYTIPPAVLLFYQHSLTIIFYWFTLLCYCFVLGLTVVSQALLIKNLEKQK